MPSERPRGAPSPPRRPRPLTPARRAEVERLVRAPLMTVVRAFALADACGQLLRFHDAATAFGVEPVPPPAPPPHPGQLPLFPCDERTETMPT